MVRNIDFPEALVFYETTDDSTSTLLEDDGQTPRSGLLDLLQECQDTSTPALLISRQTQLPSELAPFLQRFEENSPTPSPISLWECIHSLTIQPEGFGGSSGFGRKMADPERPPMPKHVVVFCSDLDVCRAARSVGMRVLCLQDNDLADAIIDDFYNLYLEDVATPGSFWLNPPYPRDDDGNKVYVEDVLEEDVVESEMTQQIVKDDEDLSDDELQAILNDMEPL